ncbi:hypothetical protein [Georgenia sp. Z1491]|uniref:hypothetical protein n=1 Tax=Georgenia sp. Z1491 TaxID=3416707 RepID=UPI003CE7FCC5
MSDVLQLDEMTFDAMKRYHLEAADAGAQLAEPADGDFGWGDVEVAGIVARIAEWIGSSITHNAEVAAVLQYTWDNFQEDDDDAAALFGTV